MVKSMLWFIYVCCDSITQKVYIFQFVYTNIQHIEQMLRKSEQNYNLISVQTNGVVKKKN